MSGPGTVTFGNTSVTNTTASIPELVKEMTKTLEQDKRGDYHIRDLEVRLGRFAKDFPGQISEVNTDHIETWLRGLKSLAKRTRRGGDSAAVIMEDYLELATPEEAVAWFKVSLSAQQFKALTAYANKLKQASSMLFKPQSPREAARRVASRCRCVGARQEARCLEAKQSRWVRSLCGYRGCESPIPPILHQTNLLLQLTRCDGRKPPNLGQEFSNN